MENLYSNSNQLGARLLAASILILDPKAQIHSAQAESYGFSCEFSTLNLFDNTKFPFLEEMMQSFVKKEEIKTFEMIRDSAVEFLIYHGQKRKGAELKQWENGLVNVVQVGSFADVLEDEIDLDSLLDSLKFFKILECQAPSKLAEGRKTFYIKGCASSSVFEMKEELKRIKSFKSDSHAFKGIKEGYFEFFEKDGQNSAVFFEKGEKVLSSLFTLVKDYFLSKRLSFIRVSAQFEEESDQIECFSLAGFSYLKGWFFQDFISTSIDTKESDLGLFNIPQNTQISTFKKAVNEDLEKILFLHLSDVLELFETLGVEVGFKLVPFRKKISKKIDAFKIFSKFLSGCSSSLSHSVSQYQKNSDYELVFTAKDFLEREWEIARCEIDDRKNPYYIRLDLLSLERVFAVLLDSSKESLSKINLI